MAPVQVLVPTYNNARFIGQAIESALEQDCDDVRVLVVDNASTDDTPAVVARYAGVEYVRNPENVGAIANHNRCLELATGDYIKMLSSDDVLLPGMLRKQSELLDRHPDIGVVTCDYVITDAALQEIGRWSFPHGRHSGRAIVAECARKMTNLVGGPSNVLLRRSLVGQRRFDASLKWLGDLEFFCQLLLTTDYGSIDEPGFLYRRHGSTHSVLGCPPAVRLSDEARFVAKYGGGIPGRARVYYRWLRSQWVTTARHTNATTS